MAFGSRSGDGYLVHLEDGRLSLVEYDFRGLEEQKDRRDFWQSIRDGSPVHLADKSTQPT